MQGAVWPQLPRAPAGTDVPLWNSRRAEGWMDECLLWPLWAAAFVTSSLTLC